MPHNETLKAIGNITDPGKFELLATDVLRYAEDKYRCLTQPGVNTKGKTVKSPVDGVVILQDHLIAVHHTIGERSGLEKKWLSEVPNNKGDVVKTIEIIEDERKNLNNLKATLVLTANCEPTDEVLRKVNKVALKVGLEIDYWSATRIACFLDTDADGQWLRKKYLDITQERVSKDLLGQISKENLDRFKPSDNQDAWIEIKSDEDLEKHVSPLKFVIAESGKGKTVAAYKQLKKHISKGLYGISVPINLVDEEYTLEGCIKSCLKIVRPKLDDDCGLDVLRIINTNNQFMLFIDDINNSKNITKTIDKLAEWSSRSQNIIILCPIYPSNISLLDESKKKELKKHFIYLNDFSRNEAELLVHRRYETLGKELTPLQCQEIASSLAYDPLLISLNSELDISKVSNVIDKYISNKLEELSVINQKYFYSEYYTALLCLAEYIWRNGLLTPTWTDIVNSDLSKDQISIIRIILTKQPSIIKLARYLNDEVIQYRHDKIKLLLIADSIKDLFVKEELSDDTLSDPYHAELFGYALNRNGIKPEHVHLIKSKNPLALFYSISDYSYADSPQCEVIYSHAKSFLHSEDSSKIKYSNLISTALYKISRARNGYINSLLQGLDTPNWNVQFARFKNGDIGAGIFLCSQIHPGSNYLELEALIEDWLLRAKNVIVSNLIKIFLDTKLTLNQKQGFLIFCGYTRDDSLYETIINLWENLNNDEKAALLDAYLWAAAHCAGSKPDEILDPALSAWDNLSDERSEIGTSEKSDFAAHHVRWAFRKYIPKNSISYFVRKAKSGLLTHEISYMLTGLDHPVATRYLISRYSEFLEDQRENNLTYPILIDFESEWTKGLSEESKEVCKKIWESDVNSLEQREIALKFFAIKITEDELRALTEFSFPSELQNLVIKIRVIASDFDAISELKEKIIESPSFWLQFTRNFNREIFFDTLDKVFTEHEIPEHEWISSEILIDMSTDKAEELLIKHWNKLKEGHDFILAALYHATSKLVAMANDVLRSMKTPEKVFRHISYTYGLKTKGRAGITKLRQLNVLVPYIDYFDDLCIYDFAEACNEKGWFDIRKQYLDPKLLSGKYSHLDYINESNCFKRLNEYSESEHMSFMDLWLDSLQKGGLTQPEIMDIVFKWAYSLNNLSINSFKVVLTCLEHVGHRHDCKKVELLIEGQNSTFSELLINSSFQVYSRTLL